MCARVAQFLLAALFTFVVVTVAAFRYLEWWQAILASAATFVMLIWAAKMLVRAAVGQVGELAKGLFETKSRVLRGATVQVHSVRPTDPPDDLPAAEDDPDADPDARQFAGELRDRAWYRIEATVFPDPKAAGPMSHWDLDDLRLAPADAPAPSFGLGADAGEDYELYDILLVTDGKPVPPDGPKLTGPQRLRFVAGVPRAVRVVQFRYYFEQFGRVRLPGPALPG